MKRSDRYGEIQTNGYASHVTHEALDKYVKRQHPEQAGFRVNILRGVMDRIPIDTLSRRRNMSRQGIYDLVKRVNEDGMKGLEINPGRPCKLTAEIAKDLREILLQSPVSYGYRQFHWDNILVRKYLKEKYNVHVVHSHLVYWLRIIGAPVQLARKRHKRVDFDTLQKVA